MSSKLMKLLISLTVLFTSGICAAAEETVNKDGWQFSADVYLWGAEIKADTVADWFKL